MTEEKNAGTFARTSELKPHPVNERIYGDRPSAEFVSSVQEKGILVPILVTSDHVIISGHSRWQAAVQLGMDRVPVAFFASEDDLDILEALIHANRQRRKTNEQLAREAQELYSVEVSRAARRKASSHLAGKDGNGFVKHKATESQGQSGDATVDSSVPANSPGPKRDDYSDCEGSESAKGEARDRVAEALGIGAKKAEAAVRVVNKIDELEASGEAEKAEKLREALNKSVNKAAEALKTIDAESDGEPGESSQPDDLKEAYANDDSTSKEEVPSDEKGKPLPAKALEAFAMVPEIRKATRSLDELIAEVERLGKSPCGLHMHYQSVQSQLRNAKNALWQARPARVCPYCWGKKKNCQPCRGFGWVTNLLANQAPDNQEPEA